MTECTLRPQREGLGQRVPCVMKLVFSSGRSYTTSPVGHSQAVCGMGCFATAHKDPVQDHACPRSSPPTPAAGTAKMRPSNFRSSPRGAATPPLKSSPSPCTLSQSLFTWAWEHSRTCLRCSCFLLHLEAQLVRILRLPLPTQVLYLHLRLPS